MRRRKFVAAVGSLAAGSAAAVSSGAFTQVRASRGVNPTFTDDSEAYLSMYPCDGPNGEYAETNKNGTVRVNFDGLTNIGGQGIDPADGKGLNENAVTIVDKVLRIENRGTQTVSVTVSDPKPNNDLYVLSPGSIHPNSHFKYDGIYVAPTSDHSMAPGESVYLDFAVKETGADGLPDGTRPVAITATV